MRGFKWILAAVSSLFLCGMLSVSAMAATGDVVVDETTFPDPIFREFVLEKYDTDAPKGVLSLRERHAVYELYLGKLGVTSLEGIEHFDFAYSLDCANNKLTTLDVSKNKSLQIIDCRGNQLTELDVRTNTGLVEFNCSDNQLTKLDLSGNGKLEYLNCENNAISQLDISKNTALQRLSCDWSTLYRSRNTFAGREKTGLVVTGYYYLPYVRNVAGLYEGNLASIPDFRMDGVTAWKLKNGSVSGTTMTVNSVDSYAQCDYMLTDSFKVGVTVKSCFAIDDNPEDVTVSAGGTASFRIAAIGEGLTCQWKKSVDGGKTWVNSSSTGAKTGTLTMTTKGSYDGLMFRCVVKDAKGRQVASRSARLTVKAVITGQPADQKVAAGQNAIFKASADGAGLTYRWQKSTDGGKTWVNSSSTGAKTNTLTVTTKASYNGFMFRCVVTDKHGVQVISSAAKLSIAAKPVITTQPKAKTAAPDESVSFAVTATGEGLTYQWKKSTDGGKTWVNSISTGAKTNKVTMKMKSSYDGYQFKCVVTDKYGVSVVSEAAKLTLKKSNQE